MTATTTATIMITNRAFTKIGESPPMLMMSASNCQTFVKTRTAIITAMETTTNKIYFIGFGIFSPMNDPIRSMKTRRTIRLTARNGVSWIISPVACAKEITRSAMTSETIASICLFPSPRTFDFCKIAKTIVKINTNGRIVSTKIG